MDDRAIDKLELIKLLLKTEHPGIQKQILNIVTEYLNIENIAHYNALEDALKLVKSQNNAYYDRVAIHNPDAQVNVNAAQISPQ